MSSMVAGAVGSEFIKILLFHFIISAKAEYYSAGPLCRILFVWLFILTGFVAWRVPARLKKCMNIAKKTRLDVTAQITNTKKDVQTVIIQLENTNRQLEATNKQLNMVLNRLISGR